MLRPSLLCAVPALIAALACGGGGAPSLPVPPTPAAPVPAAPDPAPADPDASPTLSDGLGGALGLPDDLGMVRINDEGRVHILHPAAFEPDEVWADYTPALQAAGWTRQASPDLSAGGVYVRDGQRVALSCERAGSSVWLKAERVR